MIVHILYEKVKNTVLQLNSFLIDPWAGFQSSDSQPDFVILFNYTQGVRKKNGTYFEYKMKEEYVR